MRKLVFSVVAALYFAGTASAQNFSFAKQFGLVNSATIGATLAIDASGNTMVQVVFSGIMDFDPGAGQHLLNSADGPVIVKLDPSGNFISARQIRLPQITLGQLVLDADQNVYVVGYFSGTIDADPGPGVFSMTENGYDDIFIEKLDANGNFVWAKQVGGEARDRGTTVMFANGKIYYQGTFGTRGNLNLNTTVDFDPDPVGEYLLTSSGGNDRFIASLDSDGNFQWAQKQNVIMGGADNAGNLYYLGPWDLTPSNPNATYISKTDGNGNLVSTQEISPYSFMISTVKATASGEMLIAGGFNGTNLTIGNYSITSSTIQDALFIKINADGTVGWAKQFRGNSFAFDITAGDDGSVYLAARISGIGNVDVDPGPSAYNFNPKGNRTMVVEKLNASGGMAWVKIMPGKRNYFSEATKIAVAGSAVYTVAQFGGTVDFDPASTVYNLTAKGTNDMVIHKLTQPGGLNRMIVAEPEVPATWKLITNSRTIDIRNLSEDAMVTVMDMGGQVLYRKMNNAGSRSLLTVRAGGVYVVTVQTPKGVQTMRVVVP